MRGILACTTSVVPSDIVILELSERDPDMGLAWVQLMKEVGGEHFLRRLGAEFFERVFHPRRLRELSERSPGAALAWLEMMREVGAERIFERHGEEIFDRWSKSSVLTRLLRQKPDAFAVPLRLARITKSPRVVETVAACLGSSLRRGSADRFLLGTLPLKALADIQWLSKITGDPALVSALSALLEDSRSD